MGWPDLGFFAFIVVTAVAVSRLMSIWDDETKQRTAIWREWDASKKENTREHARDQEEPEGGDSGPPDNSQGG